MGLTKRKLGELIQLSTDSNTSAAYTLSNVRGISIQKKFIETKANMDGVPLSSYLLVKPRSFAYVTVTSRNGGKISLAFNDTTDTYIVSSTYVVFDIGRTDLLDADYLFMYFNRPEFDRYARFNSWGSARETFNWEDMCDIEIDLPPLAIQQKYVAIYKAMVANQQSYERGLEDLRLVCDGYIESLGDIPTERIGKYVERNLKKNQGALFDKTNVRGFNSDGQFIMPMRLFSGAVETFKVISRGDFVFNSRVNSTISRLSIAINEGDDLIVTPAYESFYIRDVKLLYPHYLYFLLQRDSFAKKVLFNSFGSATTFFGFDDLCDIEIPVPSIAEQKKIATVYMALKERNRLNERLKAQIRDICPILIKGSLEEGK